jgi:ABC-type multidrug transport system ATPase subunit
MFIEICRAGRDFNGLWAVRDLSTNFHPGSVIAVLGANGAGKTTLLRLLAGWLPLSEGAIRFDGSPLRRTATRLRRRVMLLDETPRRNTLPLEVLSRQINDYHADRAGIEDEVADWFDALDVTKVYRNESGNLSKGQWYKMMLVGLFVIRPDVWLLDEPFSAGLDASGIQTLETQIRACRDSGGIVVLSSQWPDHARRLADRALVLHEGRRVWEAEPSKKVPAAYLDTADAPLRAVLQGLSP